MSDVNRENDAKLHAALFGVKCEWRWSFYDYDVCAYIENQPRREYDPAFETSLATGGWVLQPFWEYAPQWKMVIVPAYTDPSDYNAVMSAEAALPNDKREVYARELHVIANQSSIYDNIGMSAEDMWNITHATPAQRVQAMLAVLAKPD